MTERPAAPCSKLSVWFSRAVLSSLLEQLFGKQSTPVYHKQPVNMRDLKPPGFGRQWAWTLWEATVPVPNKTGQLDLCCRAVDSSYNTQPQTYESTWNLRGVVNNAWHRVTAVAQ